MMIKFIWSQLRGRAGRSVALLAGVLVATAGFTVLTGATATGRLEVTGTVNSNARSAYDILVRPKGSRTSLETGAGLVRANSLSGQFGGITQQQYEQVRRLAGVDVAAPIAMLGCTTTNVSTPFDQPDRPGARPAGNPPRPHVHRRSRAQPGRRGADLRADN